MPENIDNPLFKQHPVLQNNPSPLRSPARNERTGGASFCYSEGQGPKNAPLPAGSLFFREQKSGGTGKKTAEIWPLP